MRIPEILRMIEVTEMGVLEDTHDETDHRDGSRPIKRATAGSKDVALSVDMGIRAIVAPSSPDEMTIMDPNFFSSVAGHIEHLEVRAENALGVDDVEVRSPDDIRSQIGENNHDAHFFAGYDEALIGSTMVFRAGHWRMVAAYSLEIVREIATHKGQSREFSNMTRFFGANDPIFVS